MDFIKKNKHFILLLSIILLGLFLRAWHFSDWLHFELDQSRDAKVIDLAVSEGVSNLPLLGPKAAGSFLRLGPLFYYLSYLSALVFGNTPPGIAAIVMILGTASIFVFYLFIRRFFSRNISLSLSFLFAVSLFLIMYSRFSWNPNPLPFFTILAFYSLLRAVSKEEKRKGLWLMVSAFALAFATQMHFLAFAAVPVVTAVFLFVKRPRIKLRYWLASLGIIIFLYSPAIINDIGTGGDNIGQLAKVASGKSEKSDHNILEKTIRNYAENSLGYALIISGWETPELPKVEIGKTLRPDVSCDKDCKDNIYGGLLALAFFTAGAILLLLGLWKEKERERKDFLILNFLWFGAVFALFIPISYDISPRFFLLESAVPFVFLGLMIEFIYKILPSKKARSLSVLVVAVLAVSNLVFVKKRFWQLENAPVEAFETPPDRILKERDRVTFKQQMLIADYMEKVHRENGYPVYLNSSAYYRRAFLYNLDQRGIDRDDVRNNALKSKIYRNGNYFLIVPAFANYDSNVRKYLEIYDLLETKSFGTLNVYRIYPKEDFVNAVEQEFKPKGKPESAPGVPVRFRWEEIFNEDEGGEESI